MSKYNKEELENLIQSRIYPMKQSVDCMELLEMLLRRQRLDWELIYHQEGR